MKIRLAVLCIVAASWACSPDATSDSIQATAVAADSADHVMFQVLTKLTNLGVKQADLEADTAFM